MLSIMNNRKRVHSKTIISDDEKTVIAIAVSLIISALFAGALTLLPIPSENRTAFRVLQVLFFVVMGCWHANGRSARLMPVVRNGIDGRLAFTALVALVMFIALVILYRFAVNGNLLVAGASTAAFLLPYMVLEQWHLVNRGNEDRFAAWKIADGAATPSVADTTEKIAIRIRIILGYFDNSDRTLSVAQPVSSSLGAAFAEAMLHDQDDRSTLTPAEKSAYAWEFFRENPRTAARIYFDPEKSLLENNIRDRTLIIARHVKK